MVKIVVLKVGLLILVLKMLAWLIRGLFAQQKLNLHCTVIILQLHFLAIDLCIFS